MKRYDLIILGAGASGLMLAANLPKKLSVAVIDANTKVARKLKISGGGKCNITNYYVDASHFDGSKEHVKNALKRFGRDKVLQFFERFGVRFELRKGRYYFCEESSQEIIETLLKLSAKSSFFLGEQIQTLKKESDGGFFLQTDKAEYRAKRVVVATGGKSFAHIGASDIALEIAKRFEIACEAFEPALVGLTLQKEQFWMKELSGLSCRVAITLGEKRVEEEMLFAHRGISGPAVLSASLYWKKGEISIDFLPDTDARELVESGGKKLLSALLPLPKRLAKALLKAIGLEDKAANSYTESQKKILKNLHNYTFAPAGNFGFAKAEVSRGGVCGDELSLSMESKKVQGLYFIGECVNVTGELGGYNFQWAFASAFVCANAIKSDFKKALHQTED